AQFLGLTRRNLAERAVQARRGGLSDRRCGRRRQKGTRGRVSRPNRSLQIRWAEAGLAGGLPFALIWQLSRRRNGGRGRRRPRQNIRVLLRRRSETRPHGGFGLRSKRLAR